MLTKMETREQQEPNRSWKVVGMIAKVPLVICSLIAAPLPVSVSADTLTFSFTGTVNTVAALDPQSPFPQIVDFGTLFSGPYTFDTAATNQIVGDPKTGTYNSDGGSFGITLSLGGRDLSYSGVTISIEDNYFPTTDAYFASHFETPLNSGKPTGVELSIGLTDYSGTAFANNALSSFPPLLGAFQTQTLFFTDTLVDSTNTADQVELTGNITSLTAGPEPASGYLLLVPLFYTIITLRRRCNHYR